MKLILVIIVSYLLGSIPFSHIFPKMKGQDVREKGTKNVGATNAFVVGGPLMGALALLGDVAKGFVPVFLVQRFFGEPWLVVVAGVVVMLGHVFPLFLNFKGGKAVATMGGVLLAFDPIFGAAIFLLWILTILVSRYFIPSTLVISALIPIFMAVLGFRLEYVIWGILAFLLLVYTHRRDIQRLLAGEELTSVESVKKYLGR
ncbi:glycerol-3-phosphate 1-O-acyltransferase PlsY [Candidatus Saganbacteria bacterium]|nr:glycerol-3-phosphate 1-O-acyltransferase PlsY [Candidatus Saganbacteria bacterium]